MAVGPLHATLVATEVTTLTLDLADPRGEILAYAPTPARLEVLNVDGASEVYFTVDGSVPTVGGNGCQVLPAAISSVEVSDTTAGSSTVVKLISSGTPKVSVRGL